MKSFIVFLVAIILGNFSSLVSQKVNNPAEIFQFMQKSTIMYDFAELKDSIMPPDRSNLLVENKFLRQKDGEDYFAFEYDESIFSDDLYKSGLNLLEAKKYSEASDNFKKLFEKYPDFPLALTLQAQCLYYSGNEDDAIDLFRSAISENFIDYDAHYYLAVLYDKMGLTDVAVRHILFAHILNRNDAKINNKRIELFSKKGLNTSNWVFVPQIKYKAGKSDVQMIIKQQYTGYAMAEALWLYDDDYRKTKEDPDNPLNLNKITECLASHSAVFSKIPWYGETDEGKSLRTALEKKMFTEFIYYEVILPSHPYEVHKLSEERINKLANYIMTARGEIK